MDRLYLLISIFLVFCLNQQTTGWTTSSSAHNYGITFIPAYSASCSNIDWNKTLLHMMKQTCTLFYNSTKWCILADNWMSFGMCKLLFVSYERKEEKMVKNETGVEINNDSFDNQTMSESETEFKERTNVIATGSAETESVNEDSSTVDPCVNHRFRCSTISKCPVIGSKLGAGDYYFDKLNILGSTRMLGMKIYCKTNTIFLVKMTHSIIFIVFLIILLSIMGVIVKLWTHFGTNNEIYTNT